MIADPSAGDPRSGAPSASERDVRPVVDKPRTGAPAWVWVAAAVLAGLLLFGVLDARRRNSSVPAVALPTSARLASTASPPLYVPPAPDVRDLYAETRQPRFNASPPVFQTVIRPQPERYGYPPQPQSYGSSFGRDTYAPPPQPVSEAPEPASPADERFEQQGVAAEAGLRNSSAAPPRVRASLIANRATTVLQGTLIPAVLETGFDSSRPGYARALVQRDIKGFDGSKVLIPRGSRLIGEYSSEAGPAQKRAMIAWARLVRPDGVSIAIGSPASDPVGRGGVRASVDSHFFERFSGAILQSTLDIGVNLASRSAGSPVIVALPGSLQGATSSVSRSREIAPTLKVRPGTSISVFVARDLDFTDVEARP